MTNNDLTKFRGNVHACSSLSSRLAGSAGRGYITFNSVHLDTLDTVQQMAVDRGFSVTRRPHAVHCGEELVVSLPNGAAACPKCGNDRISYFRVAGVTEARCQSPRCRHEYETPDAFAHLKG